MSDLIKLAALAATVLERAAVLVGQGWCQGALARDSDGEETDEQGGDAVAWCVSGAVRRAAFDLCGKPDMPPYTYERAEILEVNASRYVKRAICLDWDDIIGRDTEDMQGVTDWNDEDGRDAAQVLAVLARARKLLLGCPHEGH